MTQPRSANDNSDVLGSSRFRAVLFWHLRLTVATLRGELELAQQYREALDRALELAGRDDVAQRLTLAPVHGGR